VDQGARRVRVDAPEGLLDIEETKGGTRRRATTRTTWRSSRSRS
jgi:hypothetical protein